MASRLKQESPPPKSSNTLASRRSFAGLLVFAPSLGAFAPMDELERRLISLSISKVTPFAVMRWLENCHLAGQIRILDSAKVTFGSDIYRTEMDEMVAFSLGCPPQPPIYLRRHSNVYSALLAYERRWGRENPYIYLLAAVLAHEAEHILSRASESEALSRELKLLDQYSRSGQLTERAKKVINFEEYRKVIEQQRREVGMHAQTACIFK